MIFVLFALAVAPGLSIALFIYEKDKLDKEPLHLLVKLFFLGALSIVPASLLESVAELFGLGISEDSTTTAIYALAVGFSEEVSKFAFLMIFAYPKKDFNEPFDGITYGVMVAMGFATLENVLYVIEGGWQVALIRMFTAVPAHATFAVMMGYFVGLAKFRHQHFLSPYRMAGLFSAVLFHAAYDFCLFVQNYPFLVFGAFISLVLGGALSWKAIQLHHLNSPFAVPPLVHSEAGKKIPG
jgi:protease PrsW